MRPKVSFRNSKKSCGGRVNGFFFLLDIGSSCGLCSQKKLALSRGHFRDVILVTIGGLCSGEKVPAILSLTGT